MRPAGDAEINGRAAWRARTGRFSAGLRSRGQLNRNKTVIRLGGDADEAGRLCRLVVARLIAIRHASLVSSWRNSLLISCGRFVGEVRFVRLELLATVHLKLLVVVLK